MKRAHAYLLVSLFAIAVILMYKNLEPRPAPEQQFLKKALVVAINSEHNLNAEKEAEQAAKAYETMGYVVVRLYGKSATRESIGREFMTSTRLYIDLPNGEIPK